MIKGYENKELRQCAELLMQTYNCPPWNNNWTLEKAQSYLQEFVANSKFTGFTLWEGDSLIGAAFCHEQTWWTNNELYVDEFYISPLHQKKGNGKLLMQAIEEYGRQHHLAGITLLTNKNMPAYTFYKKNDFLLAENVVMLFKETK